MKPGYNLQISTNNQYIVDYSIHQTSTDTTTLEPHLSSHKAQYGSYPETVVADAGYGSEQNYTYLENNDIEGYVKYNYFDKDQHGAYLRNILLLPVSFITIRHGIHTTARWDSRCLI